ncbi:MAG: sugar transferase [Thermomicrobiales bacterium]
MTRRIKRLIDITAALIGLAALTPLLVVVALAVLIEMGRPIFFRQIRPGHSGQPFAVVKFRTLRQATVGHDGRPISNVDRLTRLGALLRRASIDEIPQLWNVLKGEMSLVGPRPLLVEYLDLYTPEQARRHEVRPGITGWAQVNGRQAVGYEQRFAFDVWYVEHWSLALDLKILARTALRLLRPTGIAGAAGVAEPAWTGSKPPAGRDGRERRNADAAIDDVSADRTRGAHAA